MEGEEGRAEKTGEEMTKRWGNKKKRGEGRGGGGGEEEEEEEEE